MSSVCTAANFPAKLNGLEYAVCDVLKKSILQQFVLIFD